MGFVHILTLAVSNTSDPQDDRMMQESLRFSEADTSASAREPAGPSEPDQRAILRV